jgi:hypothetical protein
MSFGRNLSCPGEQFEHGQNVVRMEHSSLQRNYSQTSTFKDVVQGQFIFIQFISG